MDLAELTVPLLRHAFTDLDSIAVRDMFSAAVRTLIGSVDHG